MPHTPVSATLVSHFNTRPFGSDRALVADLNQDGKPELLLHQTSGQLRSAFACQYARGNFTPLDWATHCLTAVTLEGEILWQDGTPYQDQASPYISHGGKMLAADDIDADGKIEVLVIHGTRLRILEGATGREKAAIQLPADNFTIVMTAQFGDPAKGRQIICKNNERAYEPWTYGNPTIIYNADLSIRKQAFEVRGAGHVPVVMDVDGDGRDELFVGYSMYDHDLIEKWRLDLGDDFNYVQDHADQIALSDLDGDGQLEVRFAGSEDFFVTDLQGNITWITHAGHSQNSYEGPWGPNGEHRVILNEKNLGLWGLSADGEKLWNRTDINGYAKGDVRWRNRQGAWHWSIFRPQLKPVNEFPRQSDPADSHTLWPKFIDGDGQLHEPLPWRDEYAQPARTMRAARTYDCGQQYMPLVQDLDGDGLDEIIVLDRENVWVYHA